MAQKIQSLNQIKQYLDAAAYQNIDPTEAKEQIKAAVPELYAEL
jgi:hypothetical protein